MYYQLYQFEQTLVKFQLIYSFFEVDVFWNVICKISAALFRTKYSNGIIRIKVFPEVYISKLAWD